MYKRSSSNFGAEIIIYNTNKIKPVNNELKQENTLKDDIKLPIEKGMKVQNIESKEINTPKSNSKKVLIVAQDKDLSNYIKRKLNNNDISYSSLITSLSINNYNRLQENYNR